MAQSTCSGWLQARMALAAATLVAGGALAVSVALSPAVAQADEAALSEDPSIDLHVDGNVEDEVPVTVQVTFAANDGSDASLVVSIYEGQAFTDSTTFDSLFTAPEGKKFLYWSESPDGTEGVYHFSEETPFAPTEDVTLYAIWEDADSDVTWSLVTFDANGGEGEDVAYWALTGGGYGLGLPDPSDIGITAPEGKVFAGWSFDADSMEELMAPGTILEDIPDGLFIFAMWTDAEEKAVIYFDAGEGMGEVDPVVVPIREGELYTLPECEFAAPDGKQFVGWTTDPNSDSDTIYQPGDSYAVEGDVTFYAVWQYPVITFDANGGSGEMDPVAAPFGEDYILPGCEFTAPEGKIFLGWATDPNGEGYDYSAEDFFPVSDDVTLYAVWGYPTIAFNANGGSGDMDPVSAPVGVGYILPGSEFGAPAGKVFAGWATSPDGPVVYEQEGILVPVGDVTLYAVWADAADDGGNGADGGNASNGGTQDQGNGQQQADNLAKTADVTDYAPLAVAAGVGAALVAFAAGLIRKVCSSR